MNQPIPKRVKEKNPNFAKKTFNTLLIDGSNILELSSSADTTLSSNGKQVGGIFQFFLQMKQLLKKVISVMCMYFGMGKIAVICVIP